MARRKQEEERTAAGGGGGNDTSIVLALFLPTMKFIHRSLPGGEKHGGETAKSFRKIRLYIVYSDSIYLSERAERGRVGAIRLSR